MATTVILVRHAKPLKQYDLDDFTKPLSEEGKAVQRKMNLYLKHRGIVPDQILHSPFKRAEETAELIGEDFSCAIERELSLGEYFDEDDILNKLPKPEKNMCIFLVSHGPQLMHFATYCVGTPCYKVSPPPSSCLELVFETEIAPGKAQVVDLYLP
jgi:phosphohistidine phosphatase